MTPSCPAQTLVTLRKFLGITSLFPAPTLAQILLAQRHLLSDLTGGEGAFPGPQVSPSTIPKVAYKPKELCQQKLAGREQAERAKDQQEDGGWGSGKGRNGSSHPLPSFLKSRLRI